MNVLITGADGFIGRNLRAALRQFDHRLFLIDIASSDDDLAAAAAQADFVFHLAGINRPKEVNEFQAGNTDFTVSLLAALENGKKPPVLISSSTQAALDNPYGKSKRDAEDAVHAYQARVHSPVYIYRLTNVFGKWSRPNYNSAVATFCHNIAHDLPITVSDPQYLLRLVYIDDVIDEFLRAFQGNPTVDANGFCSAGPQHEATLAQIVALIRKFHAVSTTLNLPDQRDPFVRKLFATYQSFLPPDRLAYVPKSHADTRGSFTELMHMLGYGQISVNVTKPNVRKGSHWHHTKHEKFIVVSGHGIIRFRNPFDTQVYSYPVGSNVITVIDVPPGYIHTIENIGPDDLVTLMWASEIFDPEHPDTYQQNFEPTTTGDDAL
ncbi:MAG TPA: NAD-dependent epimerase/dehydratase family protein [Candidatus Limiplasma sp.]|nr:NAD-dependent epimerase/dehydratase family protein [Candidatus Limiplasma sp.]